MPISSWCTTRRVLALLAALIFISSWDVICGWMSFYYRDFGLFGYPLAYYHRTEFWHGELPLWNPLNCTGMPFLAQWNTLVLYPGSLLYLILPLPYGLNIFLLLHQLLAGIGMFFLARQWSGSPLGAAAASILFAFNGLTLNCLMWPNNMAALGWMPLVILLCERAVIRGGASIPVAAFVGAMQMLTGAPEIILLTWILCGAVVGGLIWRDTTVWGRLGFRMLLLIILIAGLSAAQLLPFLELLRLSDRGDAGGSEVWSMPGWGLANFLLPLFDMRRSRSGVFFQPNQNWTSSYYVGICAVALALLAIWEVRRRRVWLLGSGCIVGLLLALGPNAFFYTLLVKVFPFFGTIRFPVKFVVLPVFCLPLLAAYAFTRGPVSARPNRRMMMICVAIVALVIGLTWYGSSVVELIHPPVSPWRHALGRITLLIGVGLAYALWQHAQNVRGSKPPAHLLPVCSASILLLLWGDLVTQAPDQNPTIAPAVLAPGMMASAQKMAPLPRPGEARAFLNKLCSDRIERTITDNPENDFLAHRAWMFCDSNLLDDIPLLDGFFSLYLREQHNVWALIFLNSSSNSLAPLKDFLGITQESDEKNALEWRVRTNAMPLITGGQQPMFRDHRETVLALNSDNFKPRETVYLPPGEKLTPSIMQPRPVTIQTVRFSAQKIDFTARADSPALVVIAQSSHPAWRAYVNGKVTPIHQANLAFQGIEIPSGENKVELRYQDRMFQTGAIISVTTFVACIVAILKTPPAKSCGPVFPFRRAIDSAKIGQ